MTYQNTRDLIDALEKRCSCSPTCLRDGDMGLDRYCLDCQAAATLELANLLIPRLRNEALEEARRGILKAIEDKLREPRPDTLPAGARLEGLFDAHEIVSDWIPE